MVLTDVTLSTSSSLDRPFSHKSQDHTTTWTNNVDDSKSKSISKSTTAEGEWFHLHIDIHTEIPFPPMAHIGCAILVLVFFFFSSLATAYPPRIVSIA
jgi:hypothetical protein